MNSMSISFVVHGASMSNFLQINGKLSMFKQVINYAIKDYPVVIDMGYQEIKEVCAGMAVLNP